jgi:acylpyruvate hydrolase
MKTLQEHGRSEEGSMRGAGIRVATVRIGGGTRAAAALGGDGQPGVWHLLPHGDVGELLGADDWRGDARRALTGPARDVLLEEPDFAPLVLDPRKVVCCGHNYRAHIEEMGRPVPTSPTLFTKFADTLAGARDDLVLPAHAREVDWEAELAVVVGAPLVRATREQAQAAIAGYTAANDLSVREAQRRTTQWLPGKAFDATTPLGPWLVDSLDVDPASGLRVTCEVNGEQVQQGSTADLVFDAARLLVEISAFTRLSPGDVVLTGTPGGVGTAMTPPRELADGDVVRVAVEGVGAVRNTIRFTSPSTASTDEQRGAAA